MADHTPLNPSTPREQPVRLPEGLSRAALIRAAADREGDAASRLDTSDRSSRDVAFETGLREAVSRAMGEPAQAPVGLREQIIARFEQEPSDDAAIGAAPLRMTEPTHTVSNGRSGHDARPSSLLSIFPRFAAIAAVLLLSGGLLFLGMQQFNGTSAPEGVLSVSSVSSQLQFIQREHIRCADGESGPFGSKMVASSVEEARAYAESQLGCGGVRLSEAVSRMRENGYSFVGVGPCAVPGGGRSVHALFTPTDPASHDLEPVSIFLLESPGEGCKSAKPGVCYSCPAAKQQGKPSMLWRDDSLIVFVQSGSERAVDLARAAYMAPDAVQSL